MKHEPIPILAVLLRAVNDEKLQPQIAEYVALYGGLAYASKHERKPGTLRGSDAGNCVLQVWANAHDKETIPEDPIAKTTRMMGGTNYGITYGCIIKAGIEAYYEGAYTCELEAEFLTGIGPGGATVVSHADLYIARREVADENDVNEVPHQVCEVKSNFNFRKYEPPDSHFMQCAISADGAPYGTILTVYPAIREMEERFQVRDFLISEWTSRAESDYRRLSAALEINPPREDAKEAFRCVTCKFSGCEKNKNPLREVIVA